MHLNKQGSLISALSRSRRLDQEKRGVVVADVDSEPGDVQHP